MMNKIMVSIAPPQNPTTAGEWQNAVDAASALLHIESARLYGLVKGGPAVNVERCEEVIALAKQRGVRPGKDAVERFVASYNEGARPLSGSRRAAAGKRKRERNR